MKMKIAILLSLFISAFVWSPERTITGIVLNAEKNPIAGANVSFESAKTAVQTNSEGKFQITIPSSKTNLIVSAAGYETAKITLGSASHYRIVLTATQVLMEKKLFEQQLSRDRRADVVGIHAAAAPMGSPMVVPRGNFRQADTETYKVINETGFQLAATQPVTTFAADVDRASYSNIRRFLNAGTLPPTDAVRIEEMINYFDYTYPQPEKSQPVSVTTEVTNSPWNKDLKLVHIGLQAKKIPAENLPASNLVFLLDVSGSMMDANKLPLLKQAFKLLVNQLRKEDKVSIVTYAGSAGIALQPTSGSEKTKIKNALDELEAGGSTAGSEGIETAYELAKAHFIPKGNNRVILATDGDFNVGLSGEGDLQRLIEAKRKQGIFLSVLGFGMGNYKDNLAETLADKGNGNYAYIDNIQEAQKVLIHEFGGTMFTVAKDVKIQVEFNPVHVQAYRLIGYENRKLQNEDFNDDKKDAGEMGSGHTVTAIYEIIPAGVNSNYLAKQDPLKYQQTKPAGNSSEMLTIKVRYKLPDSESSRLMEIPVANATKEWNACSENLRFASSVAEFGLLLRDSEFKGNASYTQVISQAKMALGKDDEGYRSEFIGLVKSAQLLSTETALRDK